MVTNIMNARSMKMVCYPCNSERGLTSYGDLLMSVDDENEFKKHIEFYKGGDAASLDFLGFQIERAGDAFSVKVGCDNEGFAGGFRELPESGIKEQFSKIVTVFNELDKLGKEV